MPLNRPTVPDDLDAAHRALDLAAALVLDLQRLRRRQEAGGRVDPEDRQDFARLEIVLDELVAHLRAEQDPAGLPASDHLRAMPSPEPAEPCPAPAAPWTREEAAEFVRRTERSVGAELIRLEAELRATLPGCSLVVHRLSPESLARWPDYYAPGRAGIALALVQAGTATGKPRRAAVWAAWDGACVWTGDCPGGKP